MFISNDFRIEVFGSLSSRNLKAFGSPEERRYHFSLKGDTGQFNHLITNVPGVSELVRNRRMTLSDFKIGAKKIFEFTREQKPECRYRISFCHRELSGREIAVFEQYFYKRHQCP